MFLSDEEKLKQEKIINTFKRFEQKNTKEELSKFGEELSKNGYLSQDLKELLQYLVSFKIKEKILTKSELIRLLFHLPCYVGQVLNQIKGDLDEQDYSDLYQESIDFEEDYLIPIYDLSCGNLCINSKIDQEYLYKNYSLKRNKSDKNVS